MTTDVKVIPAVLMLVIVVIAMWYPGYMLAMHMIKALSLQNREGKISAGRKATASEIVQACVPIVNLGLAHKLLYGNAKIVYIPLGLTVFAVITRFIMYLAFPQAFMVSLVSLLFTWAMIVLSWFINGYVLWDIGTCVSASFISKLLAFIFPPLSAYIIGRNCVPLMAAALAEMDTVEG